MARLGAWLVALALLSPQSVLAQDDGDEEDPFYLGLKVIELSRAGKYAEALPIAKRALRFAQQLDDPDDPDDGQILRNLNDLAEVHEALRNFAEAEPLYERALVIAEKQLELDHSGSPLLVEMEVSSNKQDFAKALTNLARIYAVQGHYDKAEPFYRRALGTSEQFGPEAYSKAVKNLADFFVEQRRFAEAEPLYSQSLSLRRKALAPNHPGVANALNDLASVYYSQGRYPAAKPLLRDALAILEALGSDETEDMATLLAHFGEVYRAENNWRLSAVYFRRSIDILIRRWRREAEGNWHKAQRFVELIKATYRIAGSPLEWTRSSAGESFEVAQWVQNFSGSSSPAQMAARAANISPDLVKLVHERQQMVNEWDEKERDLALQRERPADLRQSENETTLSNGLVSIDRRLSELRDALVKESPDYVDFVFPEPMALVDVQTEVSDREALVLFLVASDETFIWAVTKKAMRAAHIDLGSEELVEHVAALRCGLDRAAWTNAAERCAELLHMHSPKEGDPLPFDLARANELYQVLFGQIEDVIKDKQLLVVADGPLKRLPFQVLVTNLPGTSAGGWRTREVALLGAELGPLSDDRRTQLGLNSQVGVAIVRTIPGTPAAAANLQPDEVLLSVAGTLVSGVEQAIATIRAQLPGTPVPLRVLKDGKETDATVILKATTIREWLPVFLDTPPGKAAWLAKEHAIAVLPSVRSIARKRNRKASSARQPLLGFGNPLFQGTPEVPWESEAAQMAREHESCSGDPQKTPVDVSQSPTPSPLPEFDPTSGLANTATLRLQAPLPQTAAQLCAIGSQLGISLNRILLGRRAAEPEVKSISNSDGLKDFRAVQFSTHCVLAAKEAEPGLVLTPPTNPTPEDDGYLSASEIAGLRFNADWVVLPLCNTAEQRQTGFDAASELARAFLYAGARAILISHWPVDPKASVQLISRTLGAPSVDRSEALRQSMLALIDTHKSYEGHPAYWAPLVLVGDGDR